MLKISEDGTILEVCDKMAIGTIEVPEGIVKINSYAFKSCNLIEEIKLPNSLTTIGYDAFAECYSLRKINIPSSVTKIPSSAFQNCISLSILNCHSGLECVDSHAFQGCRNLALFPFSDSIKEIGYQAFCGCSLLQNVYFSKTLSSISSQSFSNCEALTEIFIPKTVRNINNEAFANCVSLSKVVITNSDVDVSATSFLGCHNLVSLYLHEINPNLILSAFADCNSLNRIYIYSGDSTSNITNVIERYSIQKSHDADLKYSSLYYRIMGMNITQMKWKESFKNLKSFKEPIDSNWEKYKICEQPLSYILGLNWDDSSGIGLILGYNDFRALDVDDCDSFSLKLLYPEDGLDGLINDFLRALGLPLDYPWVVKSGSGEGFHIIFKCEDSPATKSIDSISFEHNDKYGGTNYKHFGRIELRWKDHLVLPPSIHASGGKYAFRNLNMPHEEPLGLRLNVVDKLLLEYCGNRSFSEASYNNIEFEYTEVSKIVSRHDSYLSPHNCIADTVEWLNQIKSEESKNSLALRYLFGNDVEADGDLAVEILESCSCQSAIYNLLQLYACGFAKCDYETYHTLYDKLDTSLFSKHLESLDSNAEINIPKSELYLFFDTETTGLPKDYDAPSSDIDNWPRLVQLSWIVTDKFQNIITKHNIYIKPKGFVIPSEATKIHGITTQYALDNGIDVVSALKMLQHDLQNVRYVVGHNVLFDEKIVEAEYNRADYDMIAFFNNYDQESLCTMKSTTNFCKIPDRYYRGYKYPTLQELHKKLFDKEFLGAHDAFFDISATMKCFWELKKRGWSNDQFSPYSDEDDEIPWWV